jgi:hypothetical protein
MKEHSRWFRRSPFVRSEHKVSTYPVAVPGEGELLVGVDEDLLLTGIVLV